MLAVLTNTEYGLGLGLHIKPKTHIFYRHIFLIKILVDSLKYKSVCIEGEEGTSL